MKKGILLTAAVLSLGLSASVMAGSPDQVVSNDGFYVGGNAGIAIASGDSSSISSILDTGFTAGAHVGYRTGPFRVEGAFDYVRHDIDTAIAGLDADLNLSFFTLNGYYDFNTNTPFTPFVGAGLGVVSATMSLAGSGVTVSTDATTEFTYQAIAGVSYKLTQNVDVNAAYHLRGGDNSSGLYINTIEVGLDYYFI